MLIGQQFSMSDLSFFLCVVRVSAAFKFQGKFELNNELLKLQYTKREKRYLFDLINFTGISCSWHAIFVLSPNSKENFKSFFFIQVSILKILGRFSYFAIAFNIRSSILDKFYSSSGTCCMPSLSTILVKKLLNVFARSSFFVIKPLLLIGEIDFFE